MISEQINRTIALVENVQETEPSRELALVKTKLEEAEFWLDAAQNADTRQQRRHAARQAAKLGAKK